MMMMMTAKRDRLPENLFSRLRVEAWRVSVALPLISN